MSTTATIKQFLRQAGQQLTGSPSARLDAECLLMEVCALSRSELITRGEQPLTQTQTRQLQKLLQRRRQGEPIAHLTGRREFWSLALAVSKATLIPRPETELLVERALARIPPAARWTIADLGTGSGAVALAIASERPHCRVIATDNSGQALAVAEHNARRLGLNRVAFRVGDWLSALGEDLVDVIVSNPPYVHEDDPCLQQGDVRFEPVSALAAGRDGLSAIRAILAEARAHLPPNGRLLLEHGYDQAPAVAGLMRQAGYGDIGCYPDLAGHDRVSECRAKG